MLNCRKKLNFKNKISKLSFKRAKTYNCVLPNFSISLLSTTGIFSDAWWEMGILQCLCSLSILHVRSDISSAPQGSNWFNPERCMLVNIFKVSELIEHMSKYTHAKRANQIPNSCGNICYMLYSTILLSARDLVVLRGVELQRNMQEKTKSFFSFTRPPVILIFSHSLWSTTLNSIGWISHQEVDVL